MRICRFAFAVVCLFTFSQALFAQSSQGRILGTVQDTTGAVIPNASVTITNTASRVQRTHTADKAGEYVFTGVEPGPYEVTVVANGFQRFQRTSFRVEVARDVQVDAVMRLGTVSQTVTVTEQAPVLNTTNDVLGTTFDNQAITELPLLGRDYQNLAVLQPGIQRIPGGGFLSITANGNRPEDNNFIVDGLDDNDAYYGNQVINAEGVEGTPATHLPIDALQEFNIQSSPEAEYGDKPGAIINVGIKSGTDQLHGSMYYFHRNAALDARNWYDAAPATASAVLLHQFGASLGGPILKGKLFYFANYEGVRGKFGNPVQVDSPVTVPIGDPTNSIVDAIQECTLAGTCSPLSLSLVKYFPTNLGTNASGEDVINTDFNNLNREDNGIAKITYNLNDHNSIYGTYFHGNSVQTEEDVNVLQPEWLSQAYTDAQVYGGSWVYSANEHFSNAVHIAYNRFSQKVVTADSNVSPGTYGINTGVTDPINYGFPEIRISGFNRLGGNGSWPLYTTPDSTFIYGDTANYLRGRHNLSFGAQLRIGSTNNLRNTLGRGEIRFRDTNNCLTGSCSALEDFVQGQVSEGDVFVGDSHRVVSQTTYGFFVEDSWHLRRNVTMGWGLRYDLSLPIHEQHDLLGNFEPQLGGLVQVGKQISAPYNTDKNNLAPRLSFVWDIHGNGTTVLRAGGGIIYEVPHISVFIGQNSTAANGLGVIPTGAAGVTPGGGNIVATTYTFAPDSSTGLNQTVTNNWNAGSAIFGNLSTSLISCGYNPATGVGNPCPVLGVDPNIRTPYVENWNVNLEQALWKNAGITMAYVGNRGTKLYSLRDINQNISADDYNGDEQSGRPLVNPALCGSLCFPYLSFVDMLGNGDNSIFHSLQVTVKQQTYRGLFFVAGYTWAHSIDDATGNRAFAIQNSFNPAAERANADTDIRNRFTLAGTYTLPEHKHLRKLLNGWVANSIITAQSGMPVLFYDSSDDISGTGEYNDRWNFVGNPSSIHWSKPPNSLTFFPYYGTGAPGDTSSVCNAYAAQRVLTTNNQLSNFGCFQGPGYVILPPVPGTFGDMGRNVVSGPDYVDFDFSLIKQIHFTERIYMEVRGEVFNILNHPNFAAVDGDLSDAYSGTVGQAQFTPDIAASNPVIGSGGSRHIQLGAKVVF